MARPHKHLFSWNNYNSFAVVSLSRGAEFFPIVKKNKHSSGLTIGNDQIWPKKKSIIHFLRAVTLVEADLLLALVLGGVSGHLSDEVRWVVFTIALWHNYKVALERRENITAVEHRLSSAEAKEVLSNRERINEGNYSTVCLRADSETFSH